jgi:ADP-heptose:LPS heptosyltransferase
MDTIKFLGIKNDNQGLDYYIDPKVDVDFNTDQKFIAWSIGASQDQKKLSVNQVSDVVSETDLPIVLLGGEKERKDGEKIINKSNRDNIFNLCGKLTLDESAYIIKHSLLLLSNDTGLMHIGAALQTNLISFWGCTKPDMGFSPYASNEKSIKIVSSKSKRQCSKHGSSCRFTDDGCVKLIDFKEIYYAVEKFVS